MAKKMHVDKEQATATEKTAAKAGSQPLKEKRKNSTAASSVVPQKKPTIIPESGNHFFSFCHLDEEKNATVNPPPSSSSSSSSINSNFTGANHPKPSTASSRSTTDSRPASKYPVVASSQTAAGVEKADHSKKTTRNVSKAVTSPKQKKKAVTLPKQKKAGSLSAALSAKTTSKVPGKLTGRTTREELDAAANRLLQEAEADLDQPKTAQSTFLRRKPMIPKKSQNYSKPFGSASRIPKKSQTQSNGYSLHLNTANFASNMPQAPEFQAPLVPFQSSALPNGSSEPSRTGFWYRFFEKKDNSWGVNQGHNAMLQKSTTIFNLLFEVDGENKQVELGVGAPPTFQKFLAQVDALFSDGLKAEDHDDLNLDNGLYGFIEGTEDWNNMLQEYSIANDRDRASSNAIKLNLKGGVLPDKNAPRSISPSMAYSEDSHAQLSQPRSFPRMPAERHPSFISAAERHPFIHPSRQWQVGSSHEEAEYRTRDNHSAYHSKFDHTQSNRKPDVCRHWAKGFCRLGTRCGYLHLPVNASPTGDWPEHEPSPIQLDDFYSSSSMPPAPVPHPPPTNVHSINPISSLGTMPLVQKVLIRCKLYLMVQEAVTNLNILDSEIQQTIDMYMAHEKLNEELEKVLQWCQKNRAQVNDFFTRDRERLIADTIGRISTETGRRTR